MDLSQWHRCQSHLCRDLLAPPARATTLRTGNSVLHGVGHGRQSVHRNGLFLIFRSVQFWRLGGGNPRAPTTLDLAAWPDCAGNGFILHSDVGGRSQAEAVSSARREFAETSCAVLDALLRRRDSRGHRWFTESRWPLLCHRLGAAIYFGRKCRPIELAKHDAGKKSKRRRSPWANPAASCVDCCRCHREPPIYFRPWPRTDLVAMTSRLAISALARLPPARCRGPR